MNSRVKSKIHNYSQLYCWAVQINVSFYIFENLDQKFETAYRLSTFHFLLIKSACAVPKSPKDWSILPAQETINHKAYKKTNLENLKTDQNFKMYCSRVLRLPKKVFCPVDKSYWTTKIYRTFEGFCPSLSLSRQWPTAVNPPLMASIITMAPIIIIFKGGSRPISFRPYTIGAASLQTPNTFNKLCIFKFCKRLLL